MYGPKRKREPLEIEAFVNLEDSNFRDLQGRFVILPSGLNRFKHELQRRNLLLPAHLTDVIGFVYVDYVAGLSLFICGAVSPEFNEVFLFEEMNFPIELRLRLNHMIHPRLLVLENFWEPESSLILEKVKKEHYQDTKKNKIREITWLDPIRASQFPDHLTVFVQEETSNEISEQESIWVRPISILSLNEKNVVLEVEILNSSSNLAVKQGKFSVVSISTFADGTPLAVLQSRIQNDVAGFIHPINVREFDSKKQYKQLSQKCEKYLSEGKLEEAKVLLIELAANFENSTQSMDDPKPQVKHFYNVLEEVIFHELVSDSTPILIIKDDYAWVTKQLRQIYRN
ncbi:MAG: hypothetical protein LBV67_07760 [Streptococcaceae bacterium]|nr:hypothetical protein [Streptococcaceae bacterium]